MSKLLEIKELVVAEQHVGLRLDLYLTLKLPSYSRSFLKKQIVEERVEINEQLQFHPQYRVKLGDRVRVQVEEQPDLKKILPVEMELDIIAETEEFLAINKPAGLVVHPGSAHYDDTLANGIKAYLKSQNEDYFGVERAGLVHRLDKGTSGVIVIAKTPEALWYLSRQFAQREVRKTYLALVAGAVPEKFRVVSKLGRDKHNRQKFSSRTRRGKKADTEFINLKATERHSLVAAYPRTGRTHQIRVHLAESGTPIVGDRKYRGEQAGRMLLHAFKLEISPAPGQPKIAITAPLPEDFKHELSKRQFSQSSQGQVSAKLSKL